MKISELIAALQKIQDEHGDLPVETSGYDGSRMEQTPPRIAYRMILKGRERTFRFADTWMPDYESRKGEKVCRL